MNTPEWIEKKLDPFLQATPGRRFLIVEGQKDLEVYSRCLERLAAVQGKNPNAVQVEYAGSKWAVLRGLSWLKANGGIPPQVVAIVDRDDWSPDMIKGWCRELPALRVNGTRHCLESYFCDPEEIGAALLSQDKQKYETDWQALRHVVDVKRADWVPHWALWVTLHRAAAQLTIELEFPKAILSQKPLQKDGIIKQQLRQWARVLDVRGLFEAFGQLRASAQQARHNTQMRSHIHGKDFFNQVVLPMLQKCDRAVRADDWMVQLVEWWPQLPADLKGLLDTLLT